MKLKIVRKGVVEFIELDELKTITVPVEKDVQYQVVNDNGEEIPVKKKVIEQDLHLYLTDANTEEILILQNYQQIYPLSTLVNSELITTSAISAKSLGYVGLGLLGVGGLALAASGGGKKSSAPTMNKSFSPAEENNAVAEANVETAKGEGVKTDALPTYPIVSFHNITEDNIINIEESQKIITVRGLVDGLQQGDKLVLKVGDATYPATVENGIFSAEVDGKTLAVHQQVSAEVLRAEQRLEASSKNYQVDTIAPNPIIKINDIATDNVINRDEATGNISVSGTVDNVQNGQSIVVSCGCPSCSGIKWFDIVTKVQDGKFNVDFAGSTLVADGRSIIKANLTAEDEAGNKTPATAEKEYQTDVMISEPQITFNSIPTIHQKTERVILSGELNYDEDIDKRSVQVEILLNGKTHVAEIRDKTWSLSLSSQELALEQGTNQFSAKVKLHDIAGNNAKTEKTFEYQVDTVSPEVMLAFNPIAKISEDQYDGMTTISGRIQGEFQLTDRVLLHIGKEELTLSLSESGQFSTQVSNKLLIENGSYQLKAHFVAHDHVGNSTELDASQVYQVVIPQEKLSVQLDGITADDFINVSEAQNEKTVISGKVLGKGASVNQTVTVIMNGKGYQVQTDEHLTFRKEIDTAELVKSKTYQVSAEIGEASTTRTYDVDNNAISKIKLNWLIPQYQEDANAHPTLETSVRLTGKVNFNGLGLFGQFNNPYQLDDIRIKIGEKEYAVAVNKANQTFALDISLADLSQLQGKELSYHSNAQTIYDHKPRYSGEFTGEAVPMKAPQLTAKNIEWNSNDFIANHKVNDQFTEKMTLVQGSVEGNAKADDTIYLQIGNQQYQTVVKQDLSFELLLPTKALLENQNNVIKAVLNSQDYAGNTLTVATEMAYSKEQALNGNYVATFATANQELPYFIQGIATKATYGHLGRNALGPEKTVELKYAFDSVHYGEGNRSMIKNIFSKMSEYANVVFTEVPQGSYGYDMVFYFDNYTSSMTQGSATAGGWVKYNTIYKDNGLNSDHGFWLGSHEILHNLGTKHPHDHDGYPVTILPGIEDHKGLTVMSYAPSYKMTNPQDLRIFDIAYLHYRYGVNPNMRTGDDVYTFKRFNRATGDGDTYIWDGAGIDSFDASAENDKVYVDLTPGSWIYRGEKTENFVSTGIEKFDIKTFFNRTWGANISDQNGFDVWKDNFVEGQAFIGYGTQIERLIGSNFNDILIGNVANNAIYGGKGEDTIKGGAGDDYLDGGLDADKLYGGEGNDIFVVDHNDDKVIEEANQGTDTVYSHVESYKLTDNVENLVLFGHAKIAEGNVLDNLLKGNQLDNHLIGGDGNDRLVGGLGSDLLTGGAGEDRFIFDSALDGSVDKITDFSATEDKIVLAKTVFSSITSVENIFSHIQYDKASGKLSYDPDASGKAEPITFAQLTSGLELQASHFELI
ncbi:hypothetical protein BMT54_09385 [Pasteurellaceae bacterium 15-036681]|nr:hypothetical protein BMT54_09385 [Pasteurellaceae bacterium 15-036681]